MTRNPRFFGAADPLPMVEMAVVIMVMIVLLLPPIIVSRLRPRKRQQRADIVIICRLQRRDITPAHIAGILQIGASPRKPLAAEPHDEKIGDQPGMAAVAVRERMDLHKAVMKAHRDPVGRVWTCIQSTLSRSQATGAGRGKFIEGYAEIAFARPELPGPSPYVAEHLLVQVRDKLLAQRIASARERPSCARAMFSCSASFSSLR